MIFAWDFEDRGEGGGVGIDSVSYPVGNMLVDQDDANVFSLGKALKGRFDGCRLCFVVDDKEVFLRIGAGSDVADAREQEARYRVLVADDGEELPVFEVGVRSHCKSGQWRF